MRGRINLQEQGTGTNTPARPARLAAPARGRGPGLRVWVRPAVKVGDDASGAGPLDDRGACTPARGVVEAEPIDARTLWSLSRLSRAARSFTRALAHKC